VTRDKQTFAELFWSIWQQCGYRLPQTDTLRADEAIGDVTDVSDVTFMFELLSPRLPITIAVQTDQLLVRSLTMCFQIN
jgi:hypothetical protein